MSYMWLIPFYILSLNFLISPSESHQFQKYGLKNEMLLRFPHYVTISRVAYGGTFNCSGSIIADQWILTGQRCVIVSHFTIHFQMERFGDPQNVFSLTVDNSGVIVYPTGFDNVVLVKLPVLLKYSEIISSINISDWDYGYDSSQKGFAVMPGFDLSRSNSLTYGMYRVLSSKECKASFGQQFDEYLQICAVDWGTSNPNITYANHGSGLVQGWPLKPVLIGLYEGRMYNHERSVFAFTKLSKYANWIYETIGINALKTTNSTPTTTSIPAK